MVLDIVQGLAIGALAAISIIYTFQTRVPYPSWMLQLYDKPWLFLVLILVAVALFYHHNAIGALLLLLLGAVWIDGLIFARPLQKKQEETVQLPYIHDDSIEVFPFTEPLERRFEDPDEYGPSLDAVPLPEPLYPVFYGLDDLSPGPAPFA